MITAFEVAPTLPDDKVTQLWHLPLHHSNKTAEKTALLNPAKPEKTHADEERFEQLIIDLKEHDRFYLEFKESDSKTLAGLQEILYKKYYTHHVFDRLTKFLGFGHQADPEAPIIFAHLLFAGLEPTPYEWANMGMKNPQLFDQVRKLSRGDIVPNPELLYDQIDTLIKANYLESLEHLFARLDKKLHWLKRVMFDNWRVSNVNSELVRLTNSFESRVTREHSNQEQQNCFDLLQVDKAAFTQEIINQVVDSYIATFHLLPDANGMAIFPSGQSRKEFWLRVNSDLDELFESLQAFSLPRDEQTTVLPYRPNSLAAASFLTNVLNHEIAAQQPERASHLGYLNAPTYLDHHYRHEIQTGSSSAIRANYHLQLLARAYTKFCPILDDDFQPIRFKLDDFIFTGDEEWFSFAKAVINQDAEKLKQLKVKNVFEQGSILFSAKQLKEAWKKVQKVYRETGSYPNQIWLEWRYAAANSKPLPIPSWWFVHKDTVELSVTLDTAAEEVMQKLVQEKKYDCCDPANFFTHAYNHLFNLR